MKLPGNHQARGQERSRPIVYKGIRFRSQTEYRWAKLLDTWKEPWEYEPIYRIPDRIWYYPDFWLPRRNLWLEIKGREPNGEELSKLERLKTRRPKEECWLVWGWPAKGFVRAIGRSRFQYLTPHEAEELFFTL